MLSLQSIGAFGGVIRTAGAEAEAAGAAIDSDRETLDESLDGLRSSMEHAPSAIASVEHDEPDEACDSSSDVLRDASRRERRWGCPSTSVFSAESASDGF